MSLRTGLCCLIHTQQTTHIYRVITILKSLWMILHSVKESGEIPQPWGDSEGDESSLDINLWDLYHASVSQHNAPKFLFKISQEPVCKNMWPTTSIQSKHGGFKFPSRCLSTRFNKVAEASSALLSALEAKFKGFDVSCVICLNVFITMDMRDIGAKVRYLFSGTEDFPCATNTTIHPFHMLGTLCCWKKCEIIPKYTVVLTTIKCSEKKAVNSNRFFWKQQPHYSK